MIDYKISKNAGVLFVGINPHFGSYERGVPFSNNKTFWYLLSDAGMIKETREVIKEDYKLKNLYNKIDKIYKINFINLIDRPSKDISDLRKNEEKPGVYRLNKIIRKMKPRVVCFIGKITYMKFSNDKNFKFGLQKDLYRSKVYVMHFPLRGYANIRIKELRAVKKLSKSSSRHKIHFIPGPEKMNQIN